MRILVLHNRYNYRGGEDSVFEAECRLLREGGETVETLEFDNGGFSGPMGKLWGALAAVFHPGSFWRTWRAIRRFRPDVLHVHNLFSTATPAVIWAAWFLRVPVVMTLHNFRLLCPSATLLHEGALYERSLKAFFPWDAVRRGVYRGSKAQTLFLGLVTTTHRVLGTWKRVSRFVVLSSFGRSKFLEGRLGVPADRYLVKPNFVPDRGFALEKGDEFLFVGRLSAEKGLPTLLAAFRGSGHRLAIVGEGPLQAEVESAVLGASNIRYLGAQGSAQVLDLMRHAKALVFPSIWYEGMPMVILESFSCATPVIASRLGTMAELIQDGKNGLHFEPADADSLRQALDRLAGAPELHASLCQGARASWETGHAPAGNLLALKEVYRAAIDARS